MIKWKDSFNINNKDIKKANFLIEILKSEQKLKSL